MSTALRRGLEKVAKRFGRTVRVHKGHHHLIHPRLPLVVTAGSPKDIDICIKLARRDCERARQCSKKGSQS